MADGGVELATAYINLVPSLQGAAAHIGQGLGGPQVRGAADKAGKNIGGRMSSGMKTAMLAAGAAGVAAAGAVLVRGVADAIEREKLGDKTTASLGLSAKQSKAAGQVAGKLYAGAYGGSMAEVSSAVESVMSSIGGMSKASPKRLQAVTASVLDIASAFDIDVDQAATNAGILMKTGLAKNATEAMDLITVSLQKVPKSLRGEVMDATQEYSDSFAALGFTGKESMGLLVSASENGQYGIDKMGDAIKEFTIRSTDMSKSSKDAYKAIGLDSNEMANELLAGGDRAQTAFQKIVDGIKGIEDPAARSNAAIALFGTPLEDLGTKDIPKFLDSLTTAGDGMGTVGGASKDLGKTLNDNFSTRMEGWKRTAQVFVSDGIMAMADGFSAGRGQGQGFKGVMSNIGGVIRNVGGFLLDHKQIVLGLVAVWALWRGGLLAYRGTMAAVSAVTTVWTKATTIAAAVQRAFSAAAIGTRIQLGLLAVQEKLAAFWARALSLAAGAGQWLRATAALVGHKVAMAAVVAQQKLAALWGRALALAAGAGQWIRATASLVLYRGAVLAWTAATKIAALAQRGLNLVMRANPIGLIITAVGLLVGALVWFFTKTKLGQQIVKVAWAGIKAAISAVSSWWTKTAWPAIRNGIDAMGRWFRSAGNTIGSVWRGIRNAIGTAWNWIREQVFNRIRAGIAAVRLSFRIAQLGIQVIWNTLKNALRAGWTWVNSRVIAPFKLGLQILGLAFRIQRDRIMGFWRSLRDGLNAVGEWIRIRIFRPIRNALDAVGDAFRAVPGLVRTSWNRIKAFAARPINFVIKTVYTDGIKKLWDSVASKFGLDIKLPKINTIKGFDQGGWTGSGSRLQPAGIVHADEFVVKKASRGSIERQMPGFLDHLNRFGTVAGYAGGGLVDGAKWWIRKGARASEHPAFGGVHAGHMKNSLHYSGRAVDLNYGPGGQNAKEMAFFDRYMGAFRRAFPSLSVLWRVAGHFNHAHIDTGGHSAVGGGGGGGLDFLGLASKFSAIKNKLGEIRNSSWGRVAVAAAKKLIGGPVDYLKKRAREMLEGAGDSVGSALGGVKIEANRAQVRAAAASLGHPGWAFGKQWAALNKLITKESGWRTSAANPSSSARGLFQKMTSIHGPVESTAFGQARWGLKYIAKRYGDPLKAWAFHQNHGYYANGGRVGNVGLYDQGGWIPDRGIGVNLSGRPEAVLDPDESAALKAGLANGQPLVGQMIVKDERTAIYELEAMQRRKMVRAGLTGRR